MAPSKESTRRDPELYAKVSEKIRKEQPKNSAYRSMRISTTYEKEFHKKHPNQNAFVGKNTRKKGIRRWIDEEWINVGHYMKTGERIPCGTTAETGSYSACRPWKRITKETPKTLKGLITSKKNVIRKNVATKRIVKSRKNVKW
jgi:hypothetical protein